VTGTLRDSAGAPVQGAAVLALASGADDAFETITDDDGFYLLAAMTPGRYLLFAGLGGRTSGRIPARSIEVAHDAVQRVELREASGGGTVRVRALRADGSPAPGQALLVSSPTATPATLLGLLSSDAIFLPEPGTPTLLRRVPAGVYTLVILQGGETPPRVVRRPVTVRGDGEQLLEVRLPADLASAAGPGHEARPGPASRSVAVASAGPAPVTSPSP
jgi:hypothetical protein